MSTTIVALILAGLFFVGALVAYFRYDSDDATGTCSVLCALALMVAAGSAIVNSTDTTHDNTTRTNITSFLAPNYNVAKVYQQDGAWSADVRLITTPSCHGTIRVIVIDSEYDAEQYQIVDHLPCES